MVGSTLTKQPPHLNSSVMWRSSKCHWILLFYIVCQRCLLDIPYHKYHLPIISGLAQWHSDWSLSPEGLEEASHLDAWQQQRAVTKAEPVQTRKNNLQIPAVQWKARIKAACCGAPLSVQRDERGEEGCCWEITYLHQVMKKKRTQGLTTCW